MSKVYVVIPHYNRYDLLHARLNELHKYCKNSVTEVLVVDNGSTDGGTQGGLEWWSKFPSTTEFKVRSLRIEENIGFLLASNAGIFDTVSRCEPDDIIVLLSNDVEVRTDFVRQVTDIISQYPPSEENMGFSRAVLVGGILYTHDTGWNKFGEILYPYLEGWLLATTANNWRTIDYLDTRYAPSDYEDVDFSTKARLWNWELVPLNNPGIHHIGGQSYGYTEERRKRTEENKKKFEAKWILNSG